MKTFKFELNSKENADKTHSILLRITENRKLKRVKTGIRIFKADYNSRAEYGKWIRRSNPDYNLHNDELKRIISLSEKNKYATNENIAKIISGTDSESFFDYADGITTKLEKSGKHGTHERYSIVLSKLKTYRNNIDLKFSDITVSFLTDYQYYLENTLKNSTNTVYNNLKTIRALLYQAIREDLFPQEKNPFFRFRLHQVGTEKEKLTSEEIKKLEALELPEHSHLWNIKNYFLFSYYNAGIRISDIITLTWDNVKKDRLEYVMRKTKNNKPVKFSIKMTDKALDILSYYKTSDNQKGYIFPLLNNSKDYTDTKYYFKQLGSKT